MGMGSTGASFLQGAIRTLSTPGEVPSGLRSPSVKEPVQSAAMKFSLITALVVALALAQGSESASVVKPETFDLDTMTQYLKSISDILSKTAEDMIEKVKVQDLTDQAQAYIEESRSQFQPIADKVQEHLKPLGDKFKELQPLADTIQTQLDEIFKMALQQTKALASK